jgi:hypothetical protein
MRHSYINKDGKQIVEIYGKSGPALYSGEPDYIAMRIEAIGAKVDNLHKSTV